MTVAVAAVVRSSSRLLLLLLLLLSSWIFIHQRLHPTRAGAVVQGDV